jgi:hypothetical protein
MHTTDDTAPECITSAEIGVTLGSPLLSRVTPSDGLVANPVHPVSSGLYPAANEVDREGELVGWPSGSEQHAVGAAAAAAVSDADVEAALDELDAVNLSTAGEGTLTPDARVALQTWVRRELDARLGPAEELSTTIKKVATEIVALFSETPTNWCVCL